MKSNQFTQISADIAKALIAKDQTVCVAESSAGGLISASLLAVPGASAFFLGGGVIYTRNAREAFLPDPGEALSGVRSASESYATWLARATCGHLGATWALSESGASGPRGNSYGDKPGHSCLGVYGPEQRVLTIETGSADREPNMWAFAHAGLTLLRDAINAQAK